LEPGFVSEQDGQSLRLVERPPYGTMVQVKEEDRWQDLYSFDSSFVERTDIEIGNHYTATHPDSIFTFTRIATLPSATGRVSLMDFSFKDESAGETHQRQLQPGDDYLTTLEERFGIELDAGYDDLPPVPT
jgi:N-hydroxyarylamine O-acetyltransferase